MIEEGIRSRLVADSALSALINGRAYAVLAPTGVGTPYIAYAKISDVRRSSYCASDSITMSVFQFNSYAKTYKEAKLVAQALRNCLVDFRGLMGDTRVSTIKMENETDLLDVDPGLLRVLTTLIIWHEVT
jgi:hypothetical protein